MRGTAPDFANAHPGYGLNLRIGPDDRDDFELVFLVLIFAIGVERLARLGDGLFRCPATGNRHAVILAIEIDEKDFPIVAGRFFWVGGHAQEFGRHSSFGARRSGRARTSSQPDSARRHRAVTIEHFINGLNVTTLFI